MKVKQDVIHNYAEKTSKTGVSVYSTIQWFGKTLGGSELWVEDVWYQELVFRYIKFNRPMRFLKELGDKPRKKDIERILIHIGVNFCLM